ncbi:PfkB family carbohydrate kinase [Litorivicinus sp.]|nr:PfkB family carbohydrate kinase [Litorivicinus sp.]
MLDSHKIKSLEEVKAIVGEYPREQTVALCHGVFDIVHPGHIRHFKHVSEMADILIVSLTRDQYINKGPVQPYLPDELRAFNLAALEYVDYVVIDDNPEPLRNIEKLRPDFYAKGYEYAAGENPKTEKERKALESYGGKFLFTPGDVVFSSSKIIRSYRPNLSAEKLLAVMSGENLTFGSLIEQLDFSRKAKILVVGDVIVDGITECTPLVGMTKTPTISVKKESQEMFVGGAGIVAKHLAAAGCEVEFLSVIGNDDRASFVERDLAESGVKFTLIRDPLRVTTFKNAIVANGYRLLKVDELDNRNISDGDVAAIKARIAESDADAIVFSDFRHGIFFKESIDAFSLSIKPDVLKIADSQVASRWGNITHFKNFDLITPNEREARFALADQDSVLRPLASMIRNAADAKYAILKCGDQGVFVCRDDDRTKRSSLALDSFASEVVDAMGAGDALLAYATKMLCIKDDIAAAAIIGNLAAAMACSVDGNVPISLADIKAQVREIEKAVDGFKC